MDIETEKRFWDKVEKTPSGCWEWKASCRSGYGAFKFMGKVRSAHRVAFFLKHGHFPQGLACHRCNNKKCVNPDHIYDGTYKSNFEDAVRCGATKPFSGLQKHSFRAGYVPPNRKLGKSEVLKILQMKADGMTNRRIGHIIGIDHTTISRIMHGRLYSSLSGIPQPTQ